MRPVNNIQLMMFNYFHRLSAHLQKGKTPQVLQSFWLLAVGW